MSESASEPLVRAAVAFGVRDERVLDAVRSVPRSTFVPPGEAGRADVDEPIPIPHGQVTTQPSLVARMVEALVLTGDERVLEVGTGYGWQTALLARLSREVVSVDRFPDVVETARTNLDRRGIVNVRLVAGDGSEGVPEEAPFDAVVVSAAFPEVPVPLVDQLADGGRLVQPIGRGGNEEVVGFRKGPHGLERVRTLTGARFVRLVGRHGFER